MLGFVPIPADAGFEIGTRKADVKRVAEISGFEVSDNEINDAGTPTPDFYIARYPVTVAQFRRFLDGLRIASLGGPGRIHRFEARISHGVLAPCF